MIVESMTFASSRETIQKHFDAAFHSFACHF